jgi:hypothetical protein
MRHIYALLACLAFTVPVSLTQQELADAIEGLRSYIQFLEYGKQTPTAKIICY